MEDAAQRVNTAMYRSQAGHTLAVAHHVTADGCQFVIGMDVKMAAGQCFSFTLDHCPIVRGTVRWVVRDRVGFAFDHPVSSETQAAILNRSRVVRGLALKPA